MLSYTNKVYKLESTIQELETELKSDLKKAILHLETNTYADKFYEFDEILRAMHYYYTKILRFEDLKFEKVKTIIEDMFKEEIEYAMCEEFESFRDKAIEHIANNKVLKNQRILTYKEER